MSYEKSSASYLLDVRETAARLGLSVHTVRNKPWRARTGLRAVRVGRSLRFEVEAIERLIEASREHLPGQERDRR